MLFYSLFIQLCFFVVKLIFVYITRSIYIWYPDILVQGWKLSVDWQNDMDLLTFLCVVPCNSYITALSAAMQFCGIYQKRGILFQESYFLKLQKHLWSGEIAGKVEKNN